MATLDNHHKNYSESFEMPIRPLLLDTGPATLIPLVHVPLLKDAPRHEETAYKVVKDSFGDLCHFYGDFAGFHIYLIASCYRIRLVEGSVDYYDKKNGAYSVSISVMQDDGNPLITRVEGCKAPLCKRADGIDHYPDEISIRNFAPGTPDGLRFHLAGQLASFKFSSNLIPHMPEAFKKSNAQLFNLKIEYIGKAVGIDGSREVADRLGAGHSKESQILNEFVHRKTNRDPYAVLFKPGRLEGGQQLTFEDVVDILEKSLISSFLPPKNEQSTNFPRDDSVSANKLRAIGTDAIWLQVNSPGDYGRLYTEKVSPADVHRFEIEVPR